MPVRRMGLLGLLVLSSVGLQGKPQADQPLFRAGVELLQLDVSVLDGNRQPVRGLKASDFSILENGQRRPIRVFEAVELPAARAMSAQAAWVTAAGADVATNQASKQDGRLVVILMDRSIHVGQPVVAAKKIALAVVDALGPNDLAAVVSTSGRIPQSLTADRARLITTINQADWSTDCGPDSLCDPFTVGAASEDDGRCLCGLCVLNTLTRISDAVREAPRRRKVLFFIGSGVIVQPRPTAYGSGIGCDSHVRDARQGLFDSLALSNLTVHSIDPSGLTNTGPQTRASAMGGRGELNPQAVRLQKTKAETMELLDAQGTLQVLPDRTGGRAVLNTNAPEGKVPEIFHETDAYYVIGVEPGTPGATDARRSIDVKVGRKGVQVYAQRQYAVPPLANAPTAVPVGTLLEHALGGVLPAAGRALSLLVAAAASPIGANSVVSVNVDASTFAGVPGTPVPLEVAVAAVDQTGRQVAFARQTSTITVSRATPNGPGEADVQTQLELAPGDYEIRVAVADPTRGAVASVFSQIVIPRFGAAPLSLSDITVTVQSPLAARSPAAPRQPILTTRRVFHHDDQVDAFLQVYQGTERTEAISPVSVRVRVLDAKDRAVRDQSLVFAENQFTNRRAGCHIGIDVEHLPPGEYLVSLDASLARQTAARAVRFSVQ